MIIHQIDLSKNLTNLTKTCEWIFGHDDMKSNYYAKKTTVISSCAKI